MEWKDRKKIIEEQIQHSISVCTQVDTEDRDRLIAATEIRTLQNILNLQGSEAGIDE